jgi:hypothetical protein
VDRLEAQMSIEINWRPVLECKDEEIKRLTSDRKLGWWIITNMAAEIKRLGKVIESLDKKLTEKNEEINR